MNISKTFSPIKISTSPSESLLLLKPINSSGNDLLKFTLMELLMCGVLKMTKERVKTHPNDKSGAVTVRFISKGKNFETFKGKKFHLIFTEIFLKNPKLTLSHLAGKIFNFYLKRSISNFKIDFIYPEMKRAGLMSSRILFFYNRTSEGIELKNNIQNLLHIGEKNLDKWFKNNPQKAIHFLKLLGPNFLLLENIDFKVLQEFSGVLKETPFTTDQDNYFPDFWLYSSILSDSDFSYFDSSFDTAFESSFDIGSDAGGFDAGDSGGDY